MPIHASGPFEVELIPQSQDTAEGTTLGRMTLDKRFHGDLEAASKGEMLSAGAASGAAVYVAIERVTGTLQGRAGAFVLVHQGVMTRDAQQLTITVAPDSGAGELAGIAGQMTITIADGQHAYDFAYTLGEAG